MSISPNIPLAPYRRGLIASVKIAQKDMGLDDDTYRSLLESVTGKRSSTACTDRQLTAVLAELRAKGWTPRPRPEKSAAKKKENPLAPLRRKIAAQLLALGKPAAYAEGIVQRMYGESVSIGTSSREQLTACIAALTRQQSRASA